MRSLAPAATDLQHTLKRIQGTDQERDTLCSGKNWQKRPSESWTLSGEDFMSPDSYIFSHLEKHWNHWEWHPLFVTSSKPLPKYEPDCMYPTSLNHTTSPLTPLEQFLRALWNAVPQATVFISPPIKLNHNSHIVLFFLFFPADTQERWKSVR